MTKLQEAIDRIRIISGREPKNLTLRGLKLGEELGELLEAILAHEHPAGMAYKGIPDDAIEEEACDVIQVALSVCFLRGLDLDQIADLLDRKSDKWEEKQAIYQKSELPEEVGIIRDALHSLAKKSYNRFKSFLGSAILNP